MLLSPLADTHVPSTSSFPFTSKTPGTRHQARVFSARSYRGFSRNSPSRRLWMKPQSFMCVGNIGHQLWLNQLRFRNFRTKSV